MKIDSIYIKEIKDSISDLENYSNSTELVKMIESIQHLIPINCSLENKRVLVETQNTTDRTPMLIKTYESKLKKKLNNMNAGVILLKHLGYTIHGNELFKYDKYIRLVLPREQLKLRDQLNVLNFKSVSIIINI